jgi:hypothetical protein
MSSIPLGIVNMALVRIGAKTIASLSDGSPNSAKINNVYPYMLGQVLEAKDWKFAKTRAALSRATILDPWAQVPTLGSSSGGALGARKYSAVFTLTNAYGETKPSQPASLSIAPSHLATVAPAGSTVDATGWNAYVDILGGTAYTLQNTTPIALTATLTEALTGFTNTGASPPSANSTRPAYAWRFAYVLPTDFLRLVKSHADPKTRGRHEWGYGYDDYGIWNRSREEDVPVHPAGHPYIIEALSSGTLALMTDYYDEYESLKINYIRSVSNYLLYTSSFINCLAFRLAQELAIAIAESAAKSQEMEKLYLTALETAEGINESSDYLRDEVGGDEWVRAGRY